MASIILHFEGDRLMDVMSINMRTWWKMLRGERHDNEDGDIMGGSHPLTFCNYVR